MVTKIILKIVFTLILFVFGIWLFNHINAWVGIGTIIVLYLSTQIIFKKEITQLLNKN